MRKVALMILCVMSCVFALYYYGLYDGTSHANTYHGFAAVFALEAVLSALSLLFFWRGVKSKWVTTCYTVTVLMSILVLLTATVWGLYLLGFYLLPPQQQ